MYISEGQIAQTGNPYLLYVYNWCHICSRAEGICSSLLIQRHAEGEILSECAKTGSRLRSKTPQSHPAVLSLFIIAGAFCIISLSLSRAAVTPSKSSIHFVSASGSCGPCAHKRMRRRRCLGNYLIANALSGARLQLHCACVGHFANK